MIKGYVVIQMLLLNGKNRSFLSEKNKRNIIAIYYFNRNDAKFAAGIFFTLVFFLICMHAVKSASQYGPVEVNEMHV